MKRFISLLTALGLFFAPLGFSNENPPPAVTEFPSAWEDEEQEEPFPQGRLVTGEDPDPNASARKTRYRNWSIAAGVIILGVITLILVGRSHDGK